jgi:NifB/MoaA-like Fe-S oxidoreductase
LLDVLDSYPRLASIGLVPLGVSAHTTEPDLRPHDEREAADVLEVVDRWQTRYLAALGRRLVFAADEYYLMARRPFPTLAEYEDVPQHENGIGMARTFAEEVARALTGETGPRPNGHGGFFASVDGAPPSGYRSPRAFVVASRHPADRTAIVTGQYGAQVLRPLLPELTRASRNELRLLPVTNDFFGGNIAVTGLLTGADVAAILASEPEGDRYLLPDVVLSNGRFLDGTTVEDLPRPVDVVASDGASLVAALR